MRNASGTARPAPLAPCGLMFAAIDGAISASDSPTACQTDSDRLSPGFASAVFWVGVAATATSREQDRYQQCARQIPVREEGIAPYPVSRNGLLRRIIPPRGATTRSDQGSARAQPEVSRCLLR